MLYVLNLLVLLFLLLLYLSLYAVYITCMCTIFSNDAKKWEVVGKCDCAGTCILLIATNNWMYGIGKRFGLTCHTTGCLCGRRRCLINTYICISIQCYLGCLNFAISYKCIALHIIWICTHSHIYIYICVYMHNLCVYIISCCEVMLLVLSLFKCNEFL